MESVMREKIVIKNGSVLLPDGLKRTDIEMSGGIISKVDPSIPVGSDSLEIDAAGKFIIPGFIDIHTNGIAGFNLTLGVYDDTKDTFNSSNKLIEGSWK